MILVRDIIHGWRRLGGRLCMPLAGRVRAEARALVYVHLASCVKAKMPLADGLKAFGLDHATLQAELLPGGDVLSRGNSSLWRRMGVFLLLPWIVVYYPMAFLLLLVLGVHGRAPADAARAMACRLARHLEGGLSLSEAMARERLDFPTVDVAMVEVAELAGGLQPALQALAKLSGRAPYRPARAWYVMAIYAVALTTASSIYYVAEHVYQWSPNNKLYHELALLTLLVVAVRHFTHGYALGALLLLLLPGSLLYGIPKAESIPLSVVVIYSALVFSFVAWIMTLTGETRLRQLPLAARAVRVVSAVAIGVGVTWTSWLILPGEAAKIGTTSAAVLSVGWAVAALLFATLALALIRPVWGGRLVDTRGWQVLSSLWFRRPFYELRVMELLGVAMHAGVAECESLRRLSGSFRGEFGAQLSRAADMVQAGQPLSVALRRARVLTGRRAVRIGMLVPGNTLPMRLADAARDLERMEERSWARLERVARPVAILLLAAYVCSSNRHLYRVVLEIVGVSLA